MNPSEHPGARFKSLPTMYDLPSEDPEEPGLPDEFHDFQPKLLRETCQPTTPEATEFFIGTDLNLYFDSRHSLWHKRPDWFLVLGAASATEQADLRWSYVTWEEGINPYFVVELLTVGTENEDLGCKVREIGKPPAKWEVYERILRIPFYAVFDRDQNRLRLFALERGHYQELELEDARFWFAELGLGLGIWQGAYRGIQGQWLRWYDAAGVWVPTDAERAEQAQMRAKQAEQQLAAERQARQQLLERLQAMEINPEDLAP